MHIYLIWYLTKKISMCFAILNYQSKVRGRFFFGYVCLNPIHYTCHTNPFVLTHHHLSPRFRAPPRHPPWWRQVFQPCAIVMTFYTRYAYPWRYIRCRMFWRCQPYEVRVLCMNFVAIHCGGPHVWACNVHGVVEHGFESVCWIYAEGRHILHTRNTPTRWLGRVHIDVGFSTHTKSIRCEHLPWMQQCFSWLGCATRAMHCKWIKKVGFNGVFACATSRGEFVDFGLSHVYSK